MTAVCFPRCPDEGRCTHRCEDYCWRVLNAAPLGPAEDWPREVVLAALRARVEEDRRLARSARETARRITG